MYVLGDGWVQCSTDLRTIQRSCELRQAPGKGRRGYRGVGDIGGWKMMSSGENGQSQHLRRTVSPYMGQIVILSLVTLFLLFNSIKVHAWGPLLTAPVMWLLFSIPTYIGLKYKISWSDKEICEEASGG